MPDILLEQAVYGSQPGTGYRFLARSPGFLDDWLPEAERLCTGFGERPAGVNCPSCVFARPFRRRDVAVVQAADQGRDDAGRPGAIAFYLLILPRADYEMLGGDPFALAERYPPPWQARDLLPTLTWEGASSPVRTVEEVRASLQHDDGEILEGTDRTGQPVVRQGGSHVVLGGAQILVDGGRLIFERNAPDTPLLRRLWAVLPTRVRARLWPASFAFGNSLRFDVVVAPPTTVRTAGDEFKHYRSEREAAEYPEGRYEYAVQHAAEAGDQGELDNLFARRTQGDTIRLGLLIVAAMILIVAGVQLLFPRQPPGPPPRPTIVRETPDLPGIADYPKLDDPERRRLAEALKKLAGKLGVPRSDVPEAQLQALDERLGNPNPRRDPGKLGEQGPLQRQLRILLWKQGVPRYNDPQLNPEELVEQLEQTLADRKDEAKP